MLFALSSQLIQSSTQDVLYCLETSLIEQKPSQGDLELTEVRLVVSTENEATLGEDKLANKPLYTITARRGQQENGLIYNTQGNLRL